MGDAGGQNAGFASAGASEDKQGSLGGFHGLALLCVEPGKVCRLARTELGSDGALRAMGRDG